MNSASSGAFQTCPSTVDCSVVEKKVSKDDYSGVGYLFNRPFVSRDCLIEIDPLS